MLLWIFYGRQKWHLCMFLDNNINTWKVEGHMWSSVLLGILLSYIKALRFHHISCQGNSSECLSSRDTLLFYSWISHMVELHVSQDSPADYCMENISHFIITTATLANYAIDIMMSLTEKHCGSSLSLHDLL